MKLIDSANETELNRFPRSTTFHAAGASPVAHPDASDAAEITLFIDGGGNAWRQTYVPVSEDTANASREMHRDGTMRLRDVPLPAADFRAVEMAWLQTNLDQLTREHRGEWLAVEGRELVAHTGDLASLLAIAQAKGYAHPFITAIPADPDVRVYA